MTLGFNWKTQTPLKKIIVAWKFWLSIMKAKYEQHRLKKYPPPYIGDSPLKKRATCITLCEHFLKNV